MTVSPECRERLLELLKVGHDLEAAAATVKVDLEAIQGDAGLLSACGDAYRVATGRLRAKLLERALAGGDVYILERAIAARETSQRETFASQAVADGTDLSQLSDEQLELLEAVAARDWTALDRLVAQRVQRETAQAVSQACQQVAPSAAEPVPEINLLEQLVAEIKSHWQAWWREHEIEMAPAAISDADVWALAEQAAARQGLEVVRDQHGLPAVWIPMHGGR